MSNIVNKIHSDLYISIYGLQFLDIQPHVQLYDFLQTGNQTADAIPVLWYFWFEN